MAWDTNPTVADAVVAIGNDFEAMQWSSAPEIATTPRELHDLVVSIAGVVGAPTDDVEVVILGGNKIIAAGVLQSATSTTVVRIAAADSEADDYYNGMFFAMTGAAGEAGEVRQITDYVTSTDDITLDHALSGTPSAAETYDIFHMRQLERFIIEAADPATRDKPTVDGVQVVGYRYYIVLVRRTGTTDAHGVIASYTGDGVSAT